jgi:cell division protein FtsI/penicillin-binding protein 2
MWGGDVKNGNIPTTRKASQRKTDDGIDPARHAKSVRLRMIVIGCLLTLAMSAALVRSFMLQTEEHEQLRREASKNYVDTKPFESRRGDIVDRNGNLLAITVNRWAVVADPRYINDPAETSKILAGIVGQNAQAIARRLSPRTSSSKNDDMGTNAAIEAAKQIILPLAKDVADTVGFKANNLERPIQLMTYFYQMEQLQNPETSKVVKVLADAADTVESVVGANQNSMRLFSARGRAFAYIARNLDDEAANRISDTKSALSALCRKERQEGRKCRNPLSHVRIQPEPKRYYPKREVGAQLVGLVNRKNKGAAGLERTLDGFLESSQHNLTRVKDRRGRYIYLNGLDPNAALQPHTAQLTIDEKIQAFSEQVIQEACLVSGARAGYAIVYQVKTGEILAAANYPIYNPNDYNAWYKKRQPLRDERDALGQKGDALTWAAQSPMFRAAFPGTTDRVFKEQNAAYSSEKNAFVEFDHNYPNASRAVGIQDVYEPGSVTKVFTVAAALEEGKVDLNEVLDLENGRWILKDDEKTPIHDSHALKEGTLADIIKMSSNIGSAKIGSRLGPERLDRYFRTFGFGSVTGSGFPGEATGTLRRSSSWTDVDLKNISFGQGFSVTGIQLASALGALANGGRLMRPTIVKRILDENGNVLRDYKPQVAAQVVSEKTSRTVLDLMRAVVEPGGTGTRAYIPEYPVAGKTGTGQKSHLKKRGYANDMWVSTFFGVAPADNPELAVVILVDEPKGKRHGGGVFAAPSFKRIMRWSLKYLGVPSPYDAGKQVAWNDPAELKKRRAQAPAGKTDTHASLAPPIAASEAGNVAVPSFSGMTMDQVRRLARTSGLIVQYRGSGLARSQDIPTHERVPAWTPITVFFQPRGNLVPMAGLGDENWSGENIAGGAE